MNGIAPFDYTKYGDGGGHEWQAWLREFEWYLLANKIEDEQEKFVKLMHLASQKIQELFAILPVPEHVQKVPRGPLLGNLRPHLTDYEMALAKLDDYFQPKKNSTYERYQLRQLKQESDEKSLLSRCDYVNRLTDVTLAKNLKIM